jgi:hypothetical protein
MVVGVQTQQRRGTAAQWSASGKILAAGELGVTTDTKIIKVGDGVNEWDDLPIAFEDLYLTIGGTATNSELLGGISSDGFVKVVDATTAPTADKVARRLSDGRLQAADGTSGDDVVNFDQLVANKRLAVSRTVTANFTLAVADEGNMILANGSSYSVPLVCTLPTNASVPIPLGSVIEIRTVSTSKSPVSISPAGGVTLTGRNLIYGDGSVIRLHKRDTDAWTTISTIQSPGPLLRRKVKATIDNQFTVGSFVHMRLDGADDSGGVTYTNNADTLGANEQYNAASNLYRCFVRRSGWYDVTMQIGMAQSASGRAYVRAVVNGTPQKFGNGGFVQAAFVHCSTVASGPLPLNVDDHVEMEVYIEGGGTGQYPSDEVHAPSFFSWEWRRPL